MKLPLICTLPANDVKVAWLGWVSGADYDLAVEVDADVSRGSTSGPACPTRVDPPVRVAFTTQAARL